MGPTSISDEGRMPKELRIFVLGLVVGSTARPSTTSAQSKRPREATIVLHVVNYADLPRHVLDAARARVTSVYEVIGVCTVWVDRAATCRTA